MSKYYIVILAGSSFLYGCADTAITIKHEAEPTALSQRQACAGTTALSSSLASSFEPAEDGALLAKAIGKKDQGLLCNGKVYQSKADSKIRLFRAWNSTNQKSKLGSWWAFIKPTGKIAAYRKDYEICYQWTPLDMLVECTLKPGVKVVVGAGQSAQCSQYLTYPVSANQQIFIDNVESSLSDCKTFSGVFSWQ
jgi:hypothetical protein